MEYVLWALPKGETDRLHEKVLLVRPSTKQFETCKELAAKDGWHGFRVQGLDGTVPDFGNAVPGVDTKDVENSKPANIGQYAHLATSNMLCACGSVLSAVTFTCVRGKYCLNKK